MSVEPVGVDPRVAGIQEEMTAWRHDLHAHPELGFEETRTAALVAEKLESFGLEVHRGIGKTGVVGVLRAGKGARSLGLRADMDALPIQEVNRFGHRSRHDGRMHACGHDGHTAMLLGAAKVLAEARDFDGTVNFIFQPAEEGLGGARAMLEGGLFERFPCDAVFAMHNRPSLPVGCFAVRPGAMMAAGGFFDISVLGKGAHGARPETGVDPVAAAAHIVTALQTIVSRNIAPTLAAVVSVTRIHGGDAYNVIPECVRIGGTVRASSRAVMAQIETSMRRIAGGGAAGFGAGVEIDVRWIYPPTVNDADETALAVRVCDTIVGADGVDRNPPLSMASEDFAYFLEKVPGCYLHIGSAEDGPGCELHNPRYDFNDRALPLGASFFVRLAETRLHQRA
jgi:hippurate hydrolase